LTEFPAVPGIDGRKMSKSYGNTIAISDSPEIVTQKIGDMITDPARIKKTDPGHPEVCSVFAFHKIYSPALVAVIEKNCRAGQIGCVACKKDLALLVVAALAPIYEKRKYFEKNPEKIETILKAGAAHAQLQARATLAEVKKAVHLL
jgi:tryptophanyl-tRNA synthetase